MRGRWGSPYALATFLVVMSFIGWGFAAMGAADALKYRDAVVTTGTVVAVEMTPKGLGQPTVEWVDSAGTRWQFRSRVSRTPVPRVGDLVEVQYLAGQASTARETGPINWVFLALGVIVGTAFTTTGAFLIRRQLRADRIAAEVAARETPPASSGTSPDARRQDARRQDARRQDAPPGDY